MRTPRWTRQVGSPTWSWTSSTLALVFATSQCSYEAEPHTSDSPNSSLRSASRYSRADALGSSSSPRHSSSAAPPHGLPTRSGATGTAPAKPLRTRRSSPSTNASSPCRTPTVAASYGFSGSGRRRAADHTDRQPHRRTLRVARRGRSTRLEPQRGDDSQPARHAGPFLVAARGLRVGAPVGPARPARTRRAGRWSGPWHLVLPQSGAAHHQLRTGRLRGLRRRGGLRSRCGGPHNRAPGKGSGVAGCRRSIGDRQPLSIITYRTATALAGATRPVRRGTLRRLRRGRAAPELRLAILTMPECGRPCASPGD